MSNEPLPSYRKEDEYQYIGEMMNINIWDVEYKRLNIMTIDHYVTRFINVISKPDFEFETSFFLRRRKKTLAMG